MATYTLPELRYDYSALFDAISNVGNWADVAERLQSARQTSVELVGAGVGVD